VQAPGERVCSWCGKAAPESETDKSLSSSEFGWRVTRKKLEDGSQEVAWHCPGCWSRLKESGGSPMTR